MIKSSRIKVDFLYKVIDFMLISFFVDSNIREDDSIVEVLVVKDKLKRFRELDK